MRKRSIKDFVSDHFVAIKFLRSYCFCYGLTSAWNACDCALRYAVGVELPPGCTVSDIPDERYFQDVAANAVYKLIDEYGIVNGCAPRLSSRYSVREYVKELVSLL